MFKFILFHYFLFIIKIKCKSNFYAELRLVIISIFIFYITTIKALLLLFLF